MKVLHTSDWHLGASLGVERRQAEFEQMLAWLLALIKEQGIGAMVVAGDVFDTYAPSNSATELYYDFLTEACALGVREVIVTAGNHDSPTYLEAPKKLLRRMSVHVVGHYDHDDLDSMIIPLRETSGEVPAVVCAVPFLREHDIRQFQEGETSSEGAQRHQEGVVACYQKLCTQCRKSYPGAKIIATGHFYATGGQVASDHAVGSLNSIPLKELPPEIDYMALGHLHIPQLVDGNVRWRYPGSLLPMNFADVQVPKTVVILDTCDWSAEPQAVELPVFQRMERVTGSLEEILARLQELKASGESVWVQVENTGSFAADLQLRLREVCGDSQVKVISFHNRAVNPMIVSRGCFNGARLTECSPEEVFTKLLEQHEVTEAQRQAMLEIFRSIERELDEEDREA